MFKPSLPGKTKLIMNAWWMWNSEHFPPSEHIEPLLVSMHFQSNMRSNFLNEKNRKYLTQHGPVGCRDTESCEWLKKAGIDAYFSGCLTLTLQRNDSIQKSDYILCVDVPEPVVQAIRSRTDRPVFVISREIAPYYNSEQRFEIARCVLTMFQQAHCVISPCLHVINPCLALETPVLRLLVDNEFAIDMDKRYTGLESLYNSLSIDNFVNDPSAYDINNPPSNPQSYLKIRNNLVERCKTFTGCDSNQSPIPNGINVGLMLHQLNSYNSSLVKRSLYFARTEDLLKVWMLKTAGINQHDLVSGALYKRPKFVLYYAFRWLAGKCWDKGKRVISAPLRFLHNKKCTKP